MLDKKLILEGFDDENVIDQSTENVPELSEEEKNNFNSNIVSDLLVNFLSIFNTNQTNLLDPNIKPEIKILLEDLSDDVALCIGKIQQALKQANPEDTEKLINDGEDIAQDLIKEE